MEEGRIIRDHYAAAVILAYSLILAIVLFVLAIPVGVKIVLLVIAVAGFGAIIRAAQSRDVPMGSSPDADSIVRPRPGVHSPSGHTD